MILPRKKILAIITLTGLVLLGLLLWGRAASFMRHDYNFNIASPAGVESLKYGEWPELSNPDFYQSVKEEFVREKVSFVEANLSAMTLKIYKDGTVIKEAPILSKGKKGSWWETPAGLYEAQGKVRKHLSSFSPVYTEWNIPFQGNFFIHGWPYYKSTGKPVDTDYSGGCIRLSTEDAEEVYELVDLGMPILVYEDETTSEEPIHLYAPNLPDVSAENYLAADLDNNYVFLKKNSEETVQLTNFTKFLAALVATDYLDIERKVTVRKNMLIETEKPRLVSGRTYSIYDLLFPLLMESSNEAARAVTAPLGDARAIELMQEKAKSIGMSNTSIIDVWGKENATTPEDIFHLAKYLDNYRRFILNLSNGVVDNTAYGPSEFSWLPSTSPFTDNPEYIGGMTGQGSEGNKSSLAVFEVDFSGTKRPVAVIVIDSQDIKADTEAVLDYIKRAYK